MTSFQVSKFTTSLHNGNRIGKDVLYDACMQIENPEIDKWMPDWLPSSTEPADTCKKKRLDPFLLRQRTVLLQLRQDIMDVIADVATSSRLNNGETLPLKTHQADAASEIYDRDFALSLLSHEKNALHEIDAALRRIEVGTYGICEMSGKPIPRERLKANPFARFTVEVQSRLERERKAILLAQPVRPGVTKESEEQAETNTEL